jgi:IS5 family transposase
MVAAMKQDSFASLEYAGKKRKTLREKFLGEMDRVVPWSALVALIEPTTRRASEWGGRRSAFSACCGGIA